MELPSATFFSLAERTFAYPGVLRARLREAQREPATTQPSSAPNGSAGQRWNLRKNGGEAVAVPAERPSYLHQKLKEYRP